MFKRWFAVVNLEKASYDSCIRLANWTNMREFGLRCERVCGLEILRGDDSIHIKILKLPYLCKVLNHSLFLFQIIVPPGPKG
jgi:hypothetical protein